MEASFWHERWAKQEIGFHRSKAHELMCEYFPKLIKPSATVLVPLCGKSKDMLWLLDKGYQVFGVELSEQAVEEFFADNQLTPEITEREPFKEYRCGALVIWVGDFFDLKAAHLKSIDAWYDRAALIALPPEMRKKYVQQLNRQLPAEAKGLLITLNYPPGFRQAPPFSVSEGEVEAQLGQRFSIEQMEEVKYNEQEVEEVFKLT